MGRPPGWATKATGRPPMRSPGRPPIARREHRQRFWLAISGGLSSEDAAAAAGVSPAVGARWFREGGGMPTVSPAPLSERYLSFAEREEIAILRAQGAGGRAIARRLGRAPSTISRELRRNAATRRGRLEYRATTAQWHADRRAKRPRVARLASNDQLHGYVQERLSGTIVREDVPTVVELRRRSAAQATRLGSPLAPGPAATSRSRAARSAGRCRCPLTRRNCFAASSMPAAHQRSAIRPSRQRFTFLAS